VTPAHSMNQYRVSCGDVLQCSSNTLRDLLQRGKVLFSVASVRTFVCLLTRLQENGCMCPRESFKIDRHQDLAYGFGTNWAKTHISGCKGVRCPPIFSLSNLINVGWL